MRVKIKQLIIISLLLFLAVRISAGNDNYYFRSLSIGNGLSHTTVTSILSDHNGQLWIGTAFGLNIYNGQDIKNYFHRKQSVTSLPNSYIVFITEDSTNNIWVSTMQGLVRYNPQNDDFLPPLPGQKIQAYTFCHTPKGVLFGGDNTLYLFDTKKNTFNAQPVKFTTATPVRIYSINEWKKGVYLLLLSNGDIKEYHLSSGELKPSVFQRQANDITDIYIDKSQNLYTTSYQHGITIYDKDGKLKYRIHAGNSPLTSNAILDIEEKDQKLWIATDGEGINIMDIKNPYDITSIRHIPGNRNSLPSNSINCLYKDSRNNMWGGSVREGLFEIKKVFIQTFQEVLPGSKYGTSNKTVISLCKDQRGDMWIGTDGGGINKFNPNDRTFIHYPSTYNKKVISMVGYSNSELLVLFYLDGLYLFNKQTGRLTPYTQPIPPNSFPKRIYTIANNRILFLSDVPYIYNTDTRKYQILKTRESAKLTTNLRLINVTRNNAYLLSDNTLAKIDLRTDSLYSFFSVNQKEIVQTASYDPSGVFWIGTDQGLYRLDLKTMKCEGIKTNLFDRVSALVSENENRLWIGARNMLYTYNPKKDRFIIWDETDGFLPNELAEIYQSPTCDKYMYLGGTYGLVEIDKSIKSDQTPASDITLADVMLDGVSPSASQRDINKGVYKISIPWDYKSLQLKVIALDKDIFKKRLFRFKIFKYAIKSNEVQISESYDPTLSLNMLSSGEYSVYVSYYTDNGTWSSQKEILHLTVTTPWNKDYRVLSGIVILFFFFLYWRLMVYIRVKENKMKWKMNEVIQKNNQEKIDTLINISHELRTPLTLIYAPLKKMLENVHMSTNTSEEQTDLKRQLISIHKSASQMKNIINLTLEISRMERKGDTLHRSPHAINEWVRSVTEGFGYEMDAKDIVIEYQLDEDIALVEFDDNKCESVLSNLLMNALKFSPEHSRIIISSQLTDKFVRIAVSDAGIGLNNLNHEQLFNRFYQGEHNRQGSGIGLSYSKILIQKHGGNIGAYNNSERGATFYFELPLLAQNDVQNSPEAVTSKPDIQPDTNTQIQSEFTTRHYSLVIVEDNNELREFLQETFRSDFQTIYTASDGEEALPIISDKMPDIVISDIMMPRMDGYALCRHIKSNILTSHIPIVLLTARCDTDSTMTGYKTGADAYVPKPFEVEFLLTILRNLLQNREILKEKYRGNFIHASIGENEVPVQTTNNDEEFLVKLNKLILENLSSKDINVKYLTEQMGMSRTPLYNKLKALTGMSVNDYINQFRIEKAAMLLTRTSLSIAEISAEVGFEYQKYFSTLFKQIKGVTPTQYRLHEQDKQANKDN